MNTISATHFYNYVRCPARVYLTYYGDSSLKVKISDFIEKKIKEGILHEKNVVKTIKVIGVKEQSSEKAFEKTLELMKKGENLIYQGVLINNNLVGRPDLLKKIKGKSRFGNYYYQAEDIKLGHHVKEEYKLQIAFYSYLLGKIQNTTPKTGSIILWDKSKEEFEIDEEKFQSVFEDIQKISSVEKKEPVLCNTCRECGWRIYCLDYLKEKQDISLVYRLSRKAKTILNKQKIFTLSTLIKTNIKKLKAEGISPAGFEKFQLQAKSLLENKNILLQKQALPNTKLDVFFDIESDTNSSTKYLFGLLIKGEYKYFLAKIQEEEEQAWTNFINFFKDKEDFTIYHYGSYETTEMKKLKEKYGCNEKLYKKILSNMVDLYKIILKSYILPVYSYSIKDIAKYLGFKWKNEKAGGAQSMFWYSLWLETKDKKWLDLILEYNQDDCKATKIVKDWIIKNPQMK